jgi:hypothetical protein
VGKVCPRHWVPGTGKRSFLLYRVPGSQEPFSLGRRCRVSGRLLTPPSGEIKNAWSYTSIRPYLSLKLCLINHGDSSTLTTIKLSTKVMIIISQKMIIIVTVVETSNLTYQPKYYNEDSNWVSGEKQHSSKVSGGLSHEGRCEYRRKSRTGTRT